MVNIPHNICNLENCIYFLQGQHGKTREEILTFLVDLLSKDDHIFCFAWEDGNPHRMPLVRTKWYARLHWDVYPVAYDLKPRSTTLYRTVTNHYARTLNSIMFVKDEIFVDTIYHPSSDKLPYLTFLS